MARRLGLSLLLRLYRMRLRPQSAALTARTMILTFAMLAALVTTGRAAERITLMNGFQLRADHHALVNGEFRIYLSTGQDNYIIFAPAEIARIEDLTPPSAPSDASAEAQGAQSAPAPQNQPRLSPERVELNALTKEFSSEAELGDAGRVEAIWLKPELVNQMLEVWAKDQSQTPSQIQAAKQKINGEFDFENSLVFLIIFRSGDRGSLSQPAWGRQHPIPDIQLIGTGSVVVNPIAWSQNLGEGLTAPRWYSGVNFGYVRFRARKQDGKPVIAGSDFTIVLQNYAQPNGGKVYLAEVDFYFDASRIPLHSIVSPNAPIANSPTVSLTPLPIEQENTGVQNHSAPDYRAESFNVPDAGSEKITFGDAIGVGGFILQLLELFLK